MIRSIEWLGDRIRFIDQTALPLREEFIETSDVNVVADAIRTLKIRGAPLIGIAAAYGVAAAACGYSGKESGTFREFISRVCVLLGSTRPTAVNLRWALGRIDRIADSGHSVSTVKKRLIEEAISIHREDEEMCRSIGSHGAELIPGQATILTHCNTGALATGGDGTALSVILSAARAGKAISVFADETRPLLQGSRLTTWELMNAGIDVTLITDSTAAALMGMKKIDLVITGADRIASNGDTANKIGTYGLAVAALHHGIPMYIAAPGSTIDPSIPTGEFIPIEERNPEELTEMFGHRIAPAGVATFTPAFDVTPASLITAIITETGIHRPPFAFKKHTDIKP